MPFDITVNIIAVIVAAVAAMVIAFIWYSPSAFGNKWMKLSGIDKRKAAAMKKKGMGKTMLVGFIAALVMAYVLAVFIEATGAARYPSQKVRMLKNLSRPKITPSKP